MEPINGNFKPWICDFPGCAFHIKLKVSLKKHKRTHETVLELRKPYTCTFQDCEYRAGEKARLAEHVLGKLGNLSVPYVHPGSTQVQTLDSTFPIIPEREN